VFLSGEHDTDKRFDALSAGGDDYLGTNRSGRSNHLRLSDQRVSSLSRAP
jgi:hypothetical protein